MYTYMYICTTSGTMCYSLFHPRAAFLFIYLFIYLFISFIFQFRTTPGTMSYSLLHPPAAPCAPLKLGTDTLNPKPY
jgi:hypothetical protein